MAAKPPYWFHAKRYGWGWGLPASWQGWVVLLVWLGALTDGMRLLRGERPQQWLFLVLMIVLLTLVCYLKGEPPRWRWGGD